MLTARAIPHLHHRYPTVGDYVYDAFGNLHIQVSLMNDPRYEALVVVHELIEAILCYHRGIDEPSIAAFDIAYEAARAPDDLTSEPGHDPTAPYHDEHVFAEKVERLLAKQLGVNWKTYAAAINDLP